MLKNYSKKIFPNAFYVYIYLDPRKRGNFFYGELYFNYEPFYVGKGSKHRAQVHVNQSKNKKYDDYRHRKIRQILNENLEPIILIYKEGLTEVDAYESEKYLIHLIGRNNIKIGPLVNCNDGGKGTLGYKQTIKHKQKISEAMKGKRKTIQHRMKMSQNMKQRSRGQGNNFAKLTEQMVKEIKYYLNESVLTNKEISDIYNVSSEAICAIKKGRNWKHVDTPNRL